MKNHIGAKTKLNPSNSDSDQNVTKESATKNSDAKKTIMRNEQNKDRNVEIFEERAKDQTKITGLIPNNSESEQNISKAGATDNSDCKKPKMRNEQNKDENVESFDKRAKDQTKITGLIPKNSESEK